jgi:hypothetical protein
MTTTRHQALADRIRETILAAQRVGREDVFLDPGAEIDLRRAYGRVADRIAFLRGPAPVVVLRDLQARRLRYPKPTRRWSLARLLGLV